MCRFTNSLIQQALISDTQGKADNQSVLYIIGGCKKSKAKQIMS